MVKVTTPMPASEPISYIEFKFFFSQVTSSDSDDIKKYFVLRSTRVLRVLRMTCDDDSRFIPHPSLASTLIHPTNRAKQKNPPTRTGALMIPFFAHNAVMSFTASTITTFLCSTCRDHPTQHRKRLLGG